MKPEELRNIDHAWHRAINRHSEALPGDKWPRFMYEAKTAAAEVGRLALLFGRERAGQLDKVFRRCACCSEGRHIVDNHTTCCLGVECRKCPHLLALEQAENLTPEQIDFAKAWTCVAHIVSEGGDVMNEGYVLTVDDRMFWDGVMQSLCSTAPENEEQPLPKPAPTSNQEPSR